MNIRITFNVTKLPLYCVSVKNGRKSLEIEAFDGLVTAAIQYDFRRKPLSLSGEINVGDSVEIVLLDCRTELHINGELKDEEWPYGSRLFEMGDTFMSDTDDVNIEVSEYTVKKRELPTVVSGFENAEGWRPGGGVFVGDCMPYFDGGRYHVLYLKDRRHHTSKWGFGAHQWEHISTADFVHWDEHPTAVEIDDPIEGSICTGSWICSGGVHCLYYTVRMADGSSAPIRRSVSNDGYHFTKDRDFGFTLSERYHGASARDPKVFVGRDGLFHMLLTTSLVSEKKGCLAHLVSRDAHMNVWEELDKPIYVSADEGQPECPDYFEYRGRFYLVYSHGGRAHYMYSDRPFDGWTVPGDPIIPCSSVPKGAPWGEKMVFTGFKGIDGYAGTLTFRSAHADENGELVFE